MNDGKSLLWTDPGNCSCGKFSARSRLRRVSSCLFFLSCADNVWTKLVTSSLISCMEVCSPTGCRGNVLALFLRPPRIPRLGLHTLYSWRGCFSERIKSAVWRIFLGSGHENHSRGIKGRVLFLTDCARQVTPPWKSLSSCASQYHGLFFSQSGAKWLPLFIYLFWKRSCLLLKHILAYRTCFLSTVVLFFFVLTQCSCLIPAAFLATFIQNLIKWTFIMIINVILASFDEYEATRVLLAPPCGEALGC